MLIFKLFKKNPTGFNIDGLAIIFFIGVLIPVTCFAGKTSVEKDTNKNGLIDQRVFYDDRGKIQRVEIDSNQDQIMDKLIEEIKLRKNSYQQEHFQ